MSRATGHLKESILNEDSMPQDKKKSGSKGGNAIISSFIDDKIYEKVDRKEVKDMMKNKTNVKVSEMLLKRVQLMHEQIRQSLVL